MGMNLTDSEITVLLYMADVFVEDGSYLLEETGECDLLRKLLKKYPDVAKVCNNLTYFLEHGEPMEAKRATVGRKKTKKKTAKKKPKTTKKKKRASPQKTCPECGVKVHVRKKECPCGYVY